MFAVIARGLEAARTLGEEGLPEAALASVLTHLDAPELDPVERLLVAFTRDTIWFEPAPIQCRTRSLRDRLSPPQLLEAIGVDPP